ncbi:MAG TPA: FtsW/RodA/SpoVE family cell cycle protein, partial [Candidatus Woesebacteria bacterium]|nr:FtsW/RodA/SpoVE family cell cycle protein [Candidatus Woesebacteria bacterium]
RPELARVIAEVDSLKQNLLENTRLKNTLVEQEQMLVEKNTVLAQRIGLFETDAESYEKQLTLVQENIHSIRRAVEECAATLSNLRVTEAGLAHRLDELNREIERYQREITELDQDDEKRRQTLGNLDEQKRNLKTLLFYLLPPFILIILEPNLSTAVLISAICLVIYYLSGASFQSIVAFSCLSLVIFSLLTFLAPYRFARLKTFLKPEDNSSTATYHRNQIIYALASGGIRGKGLANSDQKYKYLPKISTDSILAIIGEETGFIGLSLLFYIYLLLIGYLFRLAGQITNPFSSLLIGGIGSWIAMQTLINAGAIANIIPLTGIPLPFISYGGSSLVTLFFSLGLVHNIEKNDNNLIYSKHGPNAGHYRYSSYSRLRTHRTTSGR